jgi:hypothetical protein
MLRIIALLPLEEGLGIQSPSPVGQEFRVRIFKLGLINN